MSDDKDKEPAASPFDKKVQEQTAATAFQLVWGWVEKLKRRAWDKVTVRAAMRSYAENYTARHGTVRVLGMARPAPLHDIYTAVRVVTREFLGAFVNHTEMEAHFKKARQQRAFSCHMVEDGINVANREPLLNLLGAPGAGKSTFLRRLGQVAMLARGQGPRVDRADPKLDTRYEHPLLPVLIELREFRAKPIDLTARIAEEFELCRFPEHRGFAEQALEGGKLLVLLDGLDEVPDAKLNEVLDHIRDFVDKHAAAGNRFVTSCRTAHYKGTLRRFTDMVLADFDDAQIEKFAGNWFSGSHHRQAETAKRFVEVLHKSTNASVLELARTPLLLTFLCLTFAHGELPPTRATLYRRAIDLLLREWAASKRVHDEPVYRELNAELELAMLAEFAAELFREDRFFFTRQRVTEHITRFMQSQLSAPKSLDAVAILEAIEIQQGLIVRRAQDTYSFSHLTIQEYLTAKHIWDEGELARRTVMQNHLHQTRWGVVFELMAGMGKTDELLRAMAAFAQRELERVCREGPEACRLLAWLDRIAPRAPGAGNPTEAANRFLGFALARDLARDHTVDLADLARGHALELATTCTIDLDCALTLARTLARALTRTRILARPLARALVDILAHRLPDGATDADARAARSALAHARESLTDPAKVTEHATVALGIDPEVLDQTADVFSIYLDSLHLIVRCKSAAYQLSADAWNEVCDTFLRLPERTSPPAPSPKKGRG